MLRNAVGSLLLASSFSLAEAESAFAATESDDAFGGPVLTTESLPVESQPVDSFLLSDPVDSGVFTSQTSSWLCPTAALFSVAGLYALRQRANLKREREAAIIREVGERLDRAGSPQALVKAESDKIGSVAFLHGRSLDTLRDARQALAVYTELEKIQFYLESVPDSSEAKAWGREALRMRSNILEKLLQYLAHCRAEILKCDFATRRHVRHFLALYVAYRDFLKDVATHKSAVTGEYTRISQQGEETYFVLQRYYRNCVSLRFV